MLPKAEYTPPTGKQDNTPNDRTGALDKSEQDQNSAALWGIYKDVMQQKNKRYLIN